MLALSERQVRRLLERSGDGSGLTPEQFIRVLESYELGSRSRQQCGIAPVNRPRHCGHQLGAFELVRRQR